MRELRLVLDFFFMVKMRKKGIPEDCAEQFHKHHIFGRNICIERVNKVHRVTTLIATFRSELGPDIKPE